MRWKTGACLVLLVVGFSALARTQTPSLQGTWRVSEIVVTGTNASTNKSPQPGLWLFAKQHYSIITVQGTTPRKDFGAPRDTAKLTDAEKIARYEVWDALTANAGTYQVSGNTFTTHPIVAKNPAAMAGPGVTREFKIDGNTLTVVQKSGTGQSASEIRTRLTRVE